MPTISSPQISLNDVYSRAGVMVRKLAVRAVGSGETVPEVRGFQLSFNANLKDINAWYDSLGITVDAGIPLQVMTQGLVADGKFGRMTAVALAGLLYAARLPDYVISSMPVVAANIPVWYAQYHSLIEGALIGAVQTGTDIPSSGPVDIDPNAPGITQELVDDSRGSGPVPVQEPPVGDVTFNEGSQIVSTAQRTGWSVPIWAIGLGLVTAGALVFGIAKRRKRAGRIAL